MSIDYSRVSELFRIIGEGDPGLGLLPCGGNLFAPGTKPYWIAPGFLTPN
jgi:hypothetical protein